MGEHVSVSSSPAIRALLAVAVALLALAASTTTARADPAWERAVKHTESVLSAYEEAKKKLEEAKKEYAAVKSLYDDAKRAYDAVKDNPEAAAAAAAALAALAVKLGVATAAVAAAQKALAIAAAAAVGFTAGTGFHQLGAAISHLCWDPICDVVAVNPAAERIYAPLTDTEVDRLLPGLLLMATGQSWTKAQFDSSHAGRTAWQFMGQAVRLFVGAARGAAAASAGRHAEVLQAATDLQSQLRAMPAVLVASADALETTRAMPARTPAAVDGALRAVNRLIGALERPRKAGDACTSKACGRVVNRAKRVRSALRRLNGVLGQLVDSSGIPKSLGGANGFFKIGSRDEFRAFVADCRTRGEACLPSWEVSVGQELLRSAGVQFRTGSLAAGLAEYDANPAGREESALFGASGFVTQAAMLRISGTTLSDRGSWLNIDLEESPLVKTARCAVQGVGCRLHRSRSRRRGRLTRSRRRLGDLPRGRFPGGQRVPQKPPGREDRYV